MIFISKNPVYFHCKNICSISYAVERGQNVYFEMLEKKKNNASFQQ